MDNLYLEQLATPTGCMLIVTDEQARLRALEWEDHEARLRRWLSRHYAEFTLHSPARARASGPKAALTAYFSGDLDAINDVSTQTPGTDFQRQVWSALRRIPVGRTTSYGALAAAIGRPMAVRAVGMANGANPIPVVVPCHRVIGADGSLTGFGGGIGRKQWLLAHEGAQLGLFRATQLTELTLTRSER
jgi:methylated-DNA-[protein]-cysteine S-methyltransferase